DANRDEFRRARQPAREARDAVSCSPGAIPETPAHSGQHRQIASQNRISPVAGGGSGRAGHVRHHQRPGPAEISFALARRGHRLFLPAVFNPDSMLHGLIEQRLRQAVAEVLPEADLSTVLVRPCPDPKFGDYQCNALISLAKAHKMNPRELAAGVVGKLDVSPWCENAEVAGAGFLNFRLKPSALTQALQAAAGGEHLFFEKDELPRTIVIDFSSPNVAKPMHVGHIRSTILGDCLARVLRLLGHRVVTDNHIGDWGTQFGMLIVGWKTLLDRAALKTDPLAEMERIYKAVQSKCDPEKPGYDSATREAARAELVKLQR